MIAQPADSPTLRLFMSNEAVNAKYDFTATEIDLMIAVIFKTQPNKPWTDKVEIYMSELRQFKRIESNGIYDTVKEALEGLASKSYKIFDREKKSFFVAPFIRSGYYEGNTGKITIGLSEEIHKLVINIKREFTSFNLASIMNLRSKHAKRLYLLCCQFGATGHRNIQLQELRQNFGLNEKYPLFADFDRFVIQPAMREINDKTEFTLDITPVKIGRSVKSLDIAITPNSHIIYSKYSEGVSEVDGAGESLKVKLKRFGLSDWQIYNVFQTLEKQQIHQAIYKMKTANKPVNNTGAYLAKTFAGMGVPMTAKMPVLQYRIHEMAADIEAVEALKRKTA